MFNILSLWKNSRQRLLAALLCLLATLSQIPNHLAYATERGPYQASGVTFSISVRTPEQIRAFYTGRGFPEAAIRELESKCLLTVGIQNNRMEIVWLEPEKWRFVTESGAAVTRTSREEWTWRWAKLDIPLASRATFGWTQLPESRDLYHGETAGGNIVMTPPAEPFSVEAIFDTGADKKGTPVTITTGMLKCAPPAGKLK